MRYLDLWFAQLKLVLAHELAYRKNFVMRMLGLAIFDIISPIIAIIIYTVSSGIPGWEFPEFLLFIGTFITVFGLEHFSFSVLPWITSWKVQEGRFDMNMLKPGNTLLFGLTECVDPEGLAEVVVGLAIIGVALSKLGLVLTTANVISYIFLIMFALLFLLSLSVIASAISFVVVKSYTIVDLFHHVRESGRYPLSIYGVTGTFILTFVLPFGLAAFYPSSALLGRLEVLMIIKVGLVSVGFFLFSVVLWNLGVKQHSSAGG